MSFPVGFIGKQPPVLEVGATEAQNRFNLTFKVRAGVLCKTSTGHLLDDHSGLILRR